MPRAWHATAALAESLLDGHHSLCRRAGLRVGWSSQPRCDEYAAARGFYGVWMEGYVDEGHGYIWSGRSRHQPGCDGGASSSAASPISSAEPKGVGLGMRVMRVPEREVATRGGRGGSPSDDGDCKWMVASGICQERSDQVT